MAKYVKIGAMLKSKEGSYYLKLSKTTDKEGNVVGTDPFPLTLKEGDTLSLEKPRDEIDFKVEKGWLTEEQGEKIKEAIPDFVKFIVKARVGDSSPKEDGDF